MLQKLPNWRSRPHLPKGPEGKAKQVAEQAAACKKKDKVARNAVRHEKKQVDISRRMQQGEDYDQVIADYPSTPETELSSNPGGWSYSEET